MIPYSQLRSQPRIPLAQAAPLPAPLTVYCEVTALCNLACKMCPMGLPDYEAIAGKRRTMTLADLQLVADNLADIGGVKSLYLHSLGEPMLNRHAADFIRMARPHAEKICLTTNGTVPLTKILDCPPDYVRVSVYGLNQTDFEETTQSTVDHRAVLENVRALRLNREARGQELPFIYVKGFGKFSVLHHRYHAYADEVDTEETMNWNGEGDFGNRESATHRKSCPAPFYIANINADMTVSVCGVDWSKKLIVGSLREESLRDIWHGERFHAIRMAHLRGERCAIDGCKKCTYLDTNLVDDVDSLTADEYERRIESTVELAVAGARC